MTIIAAMDRNRLIGRDNDLPWRLSADLQNFKKLTSGNAIIMGRKTWDSLGRPLPNRKNIIITRDKLFEAEGATVVHSVAEAMTAAGDMKCFVIGGGQIYSIAVKDADEMILTLVDTEVEGDAWFPEFNIDEWLIVEEESFQADEKNEYDFKVVKYIRK